MLITSESLKFHRLDYFFPIPDSETDRQYGRAERNFGKALLAGPEPHTATATGPYAMTKTHDHAILIQHKVHGQSEVLFRC